MKKSKENLKIVSIRELMGENLAIPSYQRPYRWGTDSAAMLVTDTFDACMNKIPEYRIGTVVLHEDEEDKGKYNIVDGQQRLTTLSILIYCFYKRTKESQYENMAKLLDAEYNALSSSAILNNFEIIRRKIGEIPDADIGRYIGYLLDECTMVKIVAGSEQEAFQFFDSQNARGKALAPHDLLKSYHLREMNDEPEASKVEIINEWENAKQNELEDLFADNLYPLVRWYQYKDGLGYSSKEIRTFKGIKIRNPYNFSIYNRAANLYIERFNAEGMYELTSGAKIRQFQLTQPLIAGKRFFLYCLYYYRLHRNVEELVDFKYKGLIPDSGSGDKYVKELFVNIVLFFVDKFNMEALTDSRLQMLYKWAYSLRLVQKAVYKESVNKYAQGRGERINQGKNMFAMLSEMNEPLEMDSVILGNVSRTQFEGSGVNVNRYNDVWQIVCDGGLKNA